MKSITLTEVQKQMLVEMLSWREYLYPYWKFEIPDGNGGYLQLPQLKKEMAPMLKIGLVKCIYGLMNDDGEVCGSGFEINYEHKEKIEKAVGKYIEFEEVLVRMENEDSEFIQYLAKLYRRCDRFQADKLKQAFPYYFEKTRNILQDIQL